MTTTTRPSSNLGAQLLDEHVRLATLCNDVLSTFEAGDREACDAAYRTLERHLETHLSFEDHELLPALARIDGKEADRLAEDHRRIRARMTEIGVGVDLHTTRAKHVRALIVDLANHARREGELMYRWAGEAFDEPTRLNWMRRLRAL
jgi:hemerythrin